MGTIYGFVLASPLGTRDALAYAFSAGGEMLAAVVASSEKDAKKRILAEAARYRMRFPDGYNFEWVDNPKDDPRLAEALRRHEALSDNDRDRR